MSLGIAVIVALFIVAVIGIVLFIMKVAVAVIIALVFFAAATIGIISLVKSRTSK